MSTVADVIAVLEAHYPPRTAESWDRVGLVCGELDVPVRRALLTVDVTREVLDDAIAQGADLVVAHHPLLLRGVHTLDPRTPKGHILTTAIKHDIAIYAAHTNADIPDDGVTAAFVTALGLVDVAPLDPRDRGPALDQLVVFVSPSATADLIDALAEAGAGAIGAYDRCHFTVDGTGSFRPLEGADPPGGTSGEVETLAEDRVEMVLPRSRRDTVLAALRAAHPYEEPAFHLLELAPTRTDASLGRIGSLPEPVTAAELAEQVADVVPETATGVRLGGDPTRTVRRVAVLGGAGDSHLEAARRAGADAYVTSDLRHHPASEALEYADAPVLVDVAHWAAEWLWLPVVERMLASEVPAVTTHVSRLCTDPWSRRFG